MRYQGKITNWNDDKGFGFVEPNGGGDRAFVHIKAFEKRTRRPVDGDVIVYEKVREKDGRYKAANIKFSRDLARELKSRKKVNSHRRRFGSVITLSFCVFLAVVTALGKLPVQISGIYFAASVIAFMAYAIDKTRAQNNRWRTKESTLHFLGLIGGWPGAYYAQNKLRHKSRKTEFKNVFWGTVVINMCVFIWLLTERGGQFLGSVIGVVKELKVFEVVDKLL